MKRTFATANLAADFPRVPKKKARKTVNPDSAVIATEMITDPIITTHIFYYLDTLRDQLAFAMLNRTTWFIDLGPLVMKNIRDARILINKTFIDLLNYTAIQVDLRTSWISTKDRAYVTYTKANSAEVEPVLKLVSRELLRFNFTKPKKTMACHPCAFLMTEKWDHPDVMNPRFADACFTDPIGYPVLLLWLYIERVINDSPNVCQVDAMDKLTVHSTDSADRADKGDALHACTEYEARYSTFHTVNDCEGRVSLDHFKLRNSSVVEDDAPLGTVIRNLKESTRVHCQVGYFHRPYTSPFTPKHYSLHGKKDNKRIGVYLRSNNRGYSQRLDSSTELVKKVKNEDEVKWPELGFGVLHGRMDLGYQKTQPAYKYHQTAMYFLKKLLKGGMYTARTVIFNCAITGFAVYYYICNYLINHDFPFVIGWKFAHISSKCYNEEVLLSGAKKTPSEIPFTPRFVFSKLVLIVCPVRSTFYTLAKMPIDVDSAHRFAKHFDCNDYTATRVLLHMGYASNPNVDLLKCYKLAGPHHGVGGPGHPKAECNNACTDGSVPVWLPFTIPKPELLCPFATGKEYECVWDFLCDFIYKDQLIKSSTEVENEESTTPMIWFGPREYYFNTNPNFKFTEEKNN